eukprot:3836152-Pyramimonas_sp.AAC.1
MLAASFHGRDCLQYEFSTKNPSNNVKKVAEKLGASGSRTAQPLGELKVPVMHASEPVSYTHLTLPTILLV